MGSPTKDYNESLEEDRPQIKKSNVRIMAGMEFKDISDEVFREYEFPTKEGGFITTKIMKPMWLNVNALSGGHRILDDNGRSHYVPAGWIRLSWKSSGEPFAF